MLIQRTGSFIEIAYLLSFPKQLIFRVSEQSWVMCRIQDNPSWHNSLWRFVNWVPKAVWHVTPHTLTHIPPPKPAIIFWPTQPKAFPVKTRFFFNKTIFLFTRFKVFTHSVSKATEFLG